MTSNNDFSGFHCYEQFSINMCSASLQSLRPSIDSRLLLPFYPLEFIHSRRSFPAVYHWLRWHLSTFNHEVVSAFLHVLNIHQIERWAELNVIFDWPKKDPMDEMVRVLDLFLRTGWVFPSPPPPASKPEVIRSVDLQYYWSKIRNILLIVVFYVGT